MNYWSPRSPGDYTWEELVGEPEPEVKTEMQTFENNLVGRRCMVRDHYVTKNGAVVAMVWEPADAGFRPNLQLVVEFDDGRIDRVDLTRLRSEVQVVAGGAILSAWQGVRT